MARLPKRLVGPVAIATGPATIYTAPSYIPNTQSTIVRHIHLQNPSASPVTVTLSIGADAAGTRILDAFSIPAQAAGVTSNILDIFCYYVLTSAQILAAASGTNNIVVITVDGDENCG
jgi:hypothetical protein